MENKQTIQTELEQVAPLLNSINKAPVQHIPEGYFDNFKVPVQATEAPVVKMHQGRRWYQLAAAAVVVGILVVGGFKLANQSKSLIEQGMLIDMAQIAKIDVEKSVQGLSSEAIDDYLKSANALAGSENSLHQYTVDAISETTVDQISDEELQLYLNESLN